MQDEADLGGFHENFYFAAEAIHLSRWEQNKGNCASQSRWVLEYSKVGQDFDETPISRQEARGLIERNAGTIGIPWYLSMILIAAIVIAGVSLFTAPYPKSMSDYVVLLALTSFVSITLSVLIIIHFKPISYDRHGISIGWFWAGKKQYDWDQVTELQKLPLLPGVAILTLSDGRWWPIFSDLDRARHLNDAISIWKSAC